MLNAHVTEPIPVQRYYSAMSYAYLGDAGRAFESRYQAFEDKDSGMPELLGEPPFKSIVDDPRYETLLAKLNLRASTRSLPRTFSID